MEDPEHDGSARSWKISGRQKRAGRKLTKNDCGKVEDIGDFLSMLLEEKGADETTMTKQTKG